MPAIRDGRSTLPFKRIIACVRSEASQKRLQDQFSEYRDYLTVTRGDNAGAARQADVAILGVDPADVSTLLAGEDLREALADKLLISVAAGWTRAKLEEALYGSATTTANHQGRARILRTLPNITSMVGQGLIAIADDPEADPPLEPEHLAVARDIFSSIGRSVELHPRLMNAATAVGGSTPAFWAIICDAFIDAAVAVGLPRAQAQEMIYQSMKGSAEMMQSGVQPGALRDQGTSPEGCTIGGIMVLEEAGVRGHLGRALREAVTLARLMETTTHVNDTRPTS